VIHSTIFVIARQLIAQPVPKQQAWNSRFLQSVLSSRNLPNSQKKFLTPIYILSVLKSSLTSMVWNISMG